MKTREVGSHGTSTTRKTITIPPGSYELDAINDEIQRQLESKGDANAFKITSNLSTFKTILEIKPDYFITFTKHIYAIFWKFN